MKRKININAIFVQKDLLKKIIAHIASFHEGKKCHSCTTCDASFDYSTSLKKHIATIHDGQ